MRTTHKDRDGELSIDGLFNYEGKITKLIEMLKDVVEEHGEDTVCKIEVFSSFPHRHSTNVRLVNKSN